MTDTAIQQGADLAIIGAGAAGVMTALQALRQATQPLQVLLFEPASTLGQGIAYATPWPEHLLNVPAARMSALPAEPGDFVDYLLQAGAFADEDRAAVGARFVPRHHFASYLQQRLAEAMDAGPATLQVVPQPVLAMQREGDMLCLRLADGSSRRACQVVLATGNNVRSMPVPGADVLALDRVAEAWDYEGVRLLAGERAVGIVGSGLSMVDSVLGLLHAGQTGAIHVYSRHGLMPLPHAHGQVATYDPQPLLAMPLRQRVHALRRHAREAAAAGIPWQSVMERIRPLGQALWQTLDAADQRRFLRHVVRQWDIHRHRIDAGVHARLQAAMERGQLQVHRVRLQGVIEADGALQLSGTVHGRARHWPLGALVNATGLETRSTGLRNPLLRQLLAQGMAAPGPHGLGLDVAVHDARLCDAAGDAHPDIAVLGSLRIGSLWETIAVPELRQQAEQAACHAVREREAAMP